MNDLKDYPLSEKERLKQAILQTNLLQEISKVRAEAFNHGNEAPKEELKEECGLEAYFTGLNLLRSKWCRNSRIYKHIERCILSRNAVFLTLTFTDDVLEKTTPETRRRYVARALKEQCFEYVANVDYGNAGKTKTYKDKNGLERVNTCREHYHAIVALPEGSKGFCMDKWKELYGFAFAERIPVKDFRKVSRYVGKLSLHAIKKNGHKPPRLIYSRVSS